MALKNRFLWTYIDWSGGQPEEKAKVWLKRSKSAPLHISFRVDCGFDRDEEEMQSIMVLLEKQIYRWGSLYLHLEPEVLQVVLQSCSQAAPSLKRLSVQCTEADAIDQAFWLFDDVTPALHSLRLRSVPVLWDSTLFNNLTRLHVADYEDDSGPTIKQLSSILQRSSAIRELELDNAGISDDAPDSDRDVIQLPELELLQITRLDRDFYVWQSCLRCPKLHTIIQNPCYREPEYEEALLETGVEEGNPYPNVKRYKSEHGARALI